MKIVRGTKLVLVLAVLLAICSGSVQAAFPPNCVTIDYPTFVYRSCYVVGNERPSYVPGWVAPVEFTPDVLIYAWAEYKNVIFLPVLSR